MVGRQPFSQHALPYTRAGPCLHCYPSYKAASAWEHHLLRAGHYSASDVFLEPLIPQDSGINPVLQLQTSGTVPPKTTSAAPTKLGFVPEDNRVYIE